MRAGRACEGGKIEPPPGAGSRAFTDTEFSERVSMLEVQNRALKKTARERAERIGELERELQQLAPEAEQHTGRRQREQLEQA